MADHRVLAGLGIAAALGGAVLWAVLSSSRLAEGPVPVAWDAVRCTRCRMLVSEPGFAAQLHTEDGRVLIFDDPGCLLVYLHEESPEVHAIWLHHHAEDRWIPQQRVVFEPVEASPMGYGLAAYEGGEVADGLEWAAAMSRVLEREAARGGRVSGTAGAREPLPGAGP